MNLADKYAKLTIQLGDIEFRLSTLQKQKQNLLTELEQFKAVVDQIQQTQAAKNETQKPKAD